MSLELAAAPCRRLDEAVPGPLGLLHWCLGDEGHAGPHVCRCGWWIRGLAREGDHPPDPPELLERFLAAGR